MARSDEVAEHYTHGSLLEAIRAGITRVGKTPETISVSVNVVKCDARCSTRQVQL